MKIAPTPFLNGALTIYQPEEGYRFSIDAVLLSYFLELKPSAKILEVGTGSGVISFLALNRFSKVKIFALEREEIFIKCLQKSIEANHFQNRLAVIKGDIMSPPFKAGFWDVIFTNPPYFKSGAGRKSPYELENIARREINFNLEIFLQKVAALLKNGGKFYMIFTALRLAELLYLLKTYKLEPKKLRLVFSYPGAEAKLALISATKNAGEEIRILPPLYIYQHKKGPYTEEVEKMLKGLY